MASPNNGIDFDKITADFITQFFKDAYQKRWEWAKVEDQKHDYFRTASEKYTTEIWEKYNSMRVFGMSEDVPLDDIFVRVNILEKTQEQFRDTLEYLHRQFDSKKREINFGEIRKTIEGVNLINSVKKIMVLGKPGAGKTTYLKYLALQSIKKDSRIKDRKIPVFISLKLLADKNIPIFNFIKYQFDKCSLEQAAPFIENLLKNGKCLLLFDGLDEVQEHCKDEIIQNIVEFSEKYRENQMVISCRIAAYNAWFTKFRDVEIADFNDKQIEEFIEKWFADKKELGKQCWEQLKKDEPLKEMAKTPLLLTLLCVAYHENLDFHVSRAELYKDAINALLKKWDSSRLVKRFEPYKTLTPDRKQDLFSYIAFQTFKEDKYFIKRQEIVQLIGEYIQNIPGIDVSELSSIAGNVLDAIIKNHGIFAIRSKGIYSFAHLTFQEYFTARYIVKYSAIKGLQVFAIEEKWREVFLLTTNMLSDAGPFLLAIYKEANKLILYEEKSKVFFEQVTRVLLSSGSKISKSYRKTIAIYLVINLARVRVRTRDLPRERAINLALDLDLAHDLARALNLARDLDRDFALARALDLDRARHLDLDLGLARNLVRDRDHALDLACNVSVSLAKIFSLKRLLLACLSTECYISQEVRAWLLENLMEINIPPENLLDD